MRNNHIPPSFPVTTPIEVKYTQVDTLYPRITLGAKTNIIGKSNIFLEGNIGPRFDLGYYGNISLGWGAKIGVDLALELAK